MIPIQSEFEFLHYYYYSHRSTSPQLKNGQCAGRNLSFPNLPPMRNHKNNDWLAIASSHLPLKVMPQSSRFAEKEGRKEENENNPPPQL